MIEAVVDHVLLKGKKPNGDPWTQLDVQKILYFCQGWHLALKGESLFTEAIEAWKDGPAIRPVHRRLGHYKERPIGPEAVLTQPEFVLSGSVRTVIDQVVEEYGQYSTGELVGMTHFPGTPWRVVRDAAGVHKGGYCDEEIPEDIILGWFSAELRRRLEPVPIIQDQSVLESEYKAIFGGTMERPWDSHPLHTS